LEDQSQTETDAVLFFKRNNADYELVAFKPSRILSERFEGGTIYRPAVGIKS